MTKSVSQWVDMQKRRVLSYQLWFEVNKRQFVKFSWWKANGNGGRTDV